MQAPDITVIIPAHNARDTIASLLDVILGVDEVAVQVIVVDDASDDGTADLLAGYAADHDNVLVLRHDSNRGAGVARNTGFPHATGRYTLFFDDDDVLHPQVMVDAIRRLDAGGQDVAILAYKYQRSLGDSRDDMNSYDVLVWERVLGSTRSTTTTLDADPDLLGLTNYPWTKIVRTEVYRAAGLQFGSTPVNNDILGHWYTLLFAGRILILDQVLCTHVVLDATNLTNRHTRIRLSLFDALDETYDLLERHPGLRARYVTQYWNSVLRVSGWASERIGPETKIEFRSRLQQHLLRINLADYSRLSLRSPGLARQIARKAIG